MGAAAHRAVGQPQGEDDGMGQPTVGAGGDVEQVEAAGQQELLKVFRLPGVALAAERVVLEELGAHLFVGLEHAPGKQGAHIKLGYPGLLQDWQRQLVAQFVPGQLLGPDDEVSFVLER